MLRQLRPRSAYDVMAAIAFFIAVAGGSAYAAATIGSSDIKNDAVKSNHIKNGQVKNPDLAANSVGTGKVINGSLLKQDFKAGQLPRGAPGPAGPTVSASASSGTSFDVPSSNTNTPTAPVQAQITTKFQSRLVANGTAAVKNTASETAPGDVECVLSRDVPPPNIVTGTGLSQRTRTRLPVSSTTEHSTIALTGRSASLPPGTYFVALHCISFSSADATIDAADVTVIAVAD